MRAAVARLTLAKERGDEHGTARAYREMVHRAAMEQQIVRRNFIDVILEDDETRLLYNLIGRILVNQNREVSGYLRTLRDMLKRALGEDTSPGSTYVIEKMGSDLYDLLSLYGAWSTLGVRVLRSKATKFPVTTALPTAAFILTEGTQIPDDTALTGSSLSPEAEVIGVMVKVSKQLFEDIDNDIAADLLEKFERSCNARLDNACFNGDGVADANNGSMTGIFQHADVAVSTAAAGNTTVTGLQEDDFLAAFGALPAGAIQRGAACWMHPTLILKAMKIKSQGQRIVKTALESDTGGALFSVCGFPLHATAAAPSTDAAGAKVAAVGEPGAYLVGIRKEFLMESSEHLRWDYLQHSFRALLRARGLMRDASGFVTIKTAAI